MLERLFKRHLEEDEPLYRVVHKHWIFFVPALTLPAAALIGTWILLYAFPILPALYVLLVADVVICLWGWRNFLDQFLDAWLITDRSVIDVAWHGWFHRQSTRIDYSGIEGVSCEIKGVLGTLFRFGTVTIEKVGTGTMVSMGNIPHPRDVESAVLLHQEACLHTKNLKDSKAVQDLLSELVAERMNLQGAKERKVANGKTKVK